MKKTKTELNLPKNILDQINIEVEKEIDEEMKELESQLDIMNWSDMENQVLSIRAKVGEVFMKKIVEAKLELSKKKVPS